MRILAPKTNITTPVDDEPIALAEAYERTKRPPGPSAEEDGPQVLWFFRGEYFWWDGLAYRAVPRKSVHSDIYRFLRGRKLKGPTTGVYRCRPEMKLINKVMDALDSVCECPFDAMPTWLEESGPIAADDVLTFPNGMLNVGAYLADADATLLPPDPRWFSSQVFPHPFTPGATCPAWQKFLGEVLRNDAERIALLQEWFGYCLTRDTSQQKLMLMVGLPRSGKSTILSVLGRIVGADNVATPRMKTLTGSFGLHPLLNKTVAILADAHISRDTDAVDVLELLKTVTGEDPVDIHRKHMDALNNVRLPIRFTVAVNEIPDLPDASNGIIPRLLALRFTNSFEGREDRTLGHRLAAEAPGILLWALEGLARLREQGAFTEPQDSKQLIEEIAHTTSPVRAFLKDECILPHQAEEEGIALDDLKSRVDDVWNRWQWWAKSNGHHSGTKIGLGKRLKAVLPNLEKPRLGERDDREHYYRGLTLRFRMGAYHTGNNHNSEEHEKEALPY